MPRFEALTWRVPIQSCYVAYREPFFCLILPLSKVFRSTTTDISDAGVGKSVTLLRLLKSLGITFTSMVTGHGAMRLRDSGSN